MSNLGSAKAAIKSELAHALEGVAYYQSLVTALEQALERLDSVGPGAAKVPGGKLEMPVKTKGRRGRKPRAASGAGGSSSGGGSLPSTAKSFWVDLVDTEPKSAVDVVHAAVKKLGFTPNEEQMKNLSQRATYALTTMVKSGEISDSGSGRARRFFREQ